MHDTLVVGMLERAGYLLRKSQCFVDGKVRLPIQPIAKTFALHVRHDVVERTVRLPGVVQREDARMVQARGEVDLPQETIGAHARGEFRPQDLDGDTAPVLQIVREMVAT